jgi:hypothetical protein
MNADERRYGTRGLFAEPFPAMCRALWPYLRASACICGSSRLDFRDVSRAATLAPWR